MSNATQIENTAAAAKKAAERLAKAQAEAQAAQAEADAAMQEAQARRNAVAREYDDQAMKNHAAVAAKRRSAVADAHTALEEAVADGGDVFHFYNRWVQARCELYAVEMEAAEDRNRRGMHAAMPRDPVFSFADDVAPIINKNAARMASDAMQALRDKREAYIQENQK